MPELRHGMAVPTAMRVGTAPVLAAYFGAFQIWPTVGGIIAVISATSGDSVAVIEGTVIGPPVTGTITATSGNSTASIIGAVGDNISGILDASSGDSVGVLAGAVAMGGTVVATSGDSTAVIVGVLAISGTIVATSGDSTADIVGSLGDNVSGVLEATSGDSQGFIAGDVAYSGVLAATSGDSTAFIDAIMSLAGILSATSGDSTASIDGVTAIPGTLAGTSGDSTGTFAGSVTVIGVMTATSDDSTAVIVGALAITGTISATSGDSTAVITGSLGSNVSGTLDATSGDSTAVMSGDIGLTAQIVATSGDSTAAITGEVALSGTVVATSGDSTASITGTISATAFPSIGASNSESGTAMGTQAINMPTGITAGNLLLAIATNDNPSTTNMTPSTGWTAIHSQVQGSNVLKLAVMARMADGGANDNLTITGAAQDYCVTTHRIVDHGAVNVADITVGSAVGTTGNADPPNVDAGAARHFLWLTAAAVDATTGNTITGVPTGYTQVGTTLTSASSTSSCLLAVAQKTADTQTENPGTFTNTSRPWIGVTIGIPKDPAPSLTGTISATSGDSTSTITGAVALSGTLTGTSGDSTATITGDVMENPFDDFNRADNASLGTPWTIRNTGTTTNMRITSNRAVPGADTQDSTMQYGTYVHDDTGYVQAKVRCDNGFAGIQALITLPFRNEVEMIIHPDGEFRIVEHNNGTEVVLDSATGAGDIEYLLRMEWEIVGSTTTLRGYVDGVLTLEGTTGNHITPGNVGISSYRQGGTLYFDDFEAGVLVPPVLTPPGVPTGLTATAGDGQVSLTWSAPGSNGGSAITDYQVQWRTTAGPGSWNTFSDGTSTATSATVTGLTNGTSYDFQVAAINAIGTGSFSATDTETPVSAGSPVVYKGGWGGEWTGTTVTFSLPGTAAVGDTVIYFLTSEAVSGATITAVPTGTTRLDGVSSTANAEVSDGGSNSFKQFAYIQTLASGFDPTPSFTFSTSVYANLVCHLLEGDVNASSWVSLNESVNAGSVRMPAVTVPANGLAVGTVASYQNGRASAAANWTAATGGDNRGILRRSTTTATQELASGFISAGDADWISIAVLLVGA
jgi:hypothetical protein